MFPDANTRRIELEYSTEDRAIFSFFNTVYAWMAVGLALTGVVAWVVSQNVTLLRAINSPLGLLIALAAFIIAWTAQGVALRVSAAAGTAMFLAYAILIGALISYIFVLYPVSTLGSAFLITGGTFGGLSAYGFLTRRDLTGIGSILIMCVWGLILATVANLFFASNGLSWLLTYATLFIFVGIVVYYTQQLKYFAQQNLHNPALMGRMAIVGSLILYAAFINLFLSILRIMGNRR
jgi:FtsH-binding integral membrane protein